MKRIKHLATLHPKMTRQARPLKLTRVLSKAAPIFHYSTILRCSIFNLINFLLILLFINISYSEEYTLEKILNTVKNHSDDIDIATLELEAGVEEAKIYQAEAMPNLSLTTGASLTGLSLNSPNMSMIKSYLENPKDHMWGSLFNWSINLHQPVITFGRVFTALKIAKVRKNFLKEKIRLDRDMYHLFVINSFCNLYRAQLKIELANKSFIYAEKVLNKIKIDLTLQKATRRDSLNAQGHLYKAKADLLKAKNEYSINLKKFIHLTEFTPPDSFKLLIDMKGWASLSDQQENTGKNIGIELKEYETSLLKLRTKYEKGKIYPSIDFVGSVYNDIQIPLKKYRDQIKSDTGISKIFDYPIPSLGNLFSPSHYNYAIGFQLNWNIFDGRRTISSYRKAHYEYKKAEIELKKLKEENQEQIEEASNALKTLKGMERGANARLKTIEALLQQIELDYTSGFVEYTKVLEVVINKIEIEHRLNEIYLQRILAVAQLKIASGLPIVKDEK